MPRAFFLRILLVQESLDYFAAALFSWIMEAKQVAFDIEDALGLISKAYSWAKTAMPP